MPRLLLFTVLLVAVTVPCLGGEIIQIPLDLGASELYLRPGDDIRLDFDAERELTDISGVHLHVTGTYGDYRTVCWQDGNFGAGVGLGDGVVGLSQGFVVDEHLDCVTEQVFGDTENGGATFDLELDFDCGDPDADWVFLAGGAGTVHLTGLDCGYLPPYPILCLCEASASVESATLVIQLGSLVAVEQQSWGTLKARYR